MNARRMNDPNFLEFVRSESRSGQRCYLSSNLLRVLQTPRVSRKFRDPDKFQRDIDSDWANKKVETFRGPVGWLPEGEWMPLKVFRKELGVENAGADEEGQKVEEDLLRLLSRPFQAVTSRFHVRSWTTP